jgi:hypothetical protein
MEVLKNSEERYLRYDFTAVEVYDLSLKLANKTQDMASTENEKKSITSQLKSKLDGIKADVSSLSNKVANGYEMRKVECEVKYHKPKQGEKTIIRTDTKEVIIEKMTSEEWNLFNQESQD